MIEFWKYVPDYQGLYEVSSQGEVRNSRTGRILKMSIRGRDYLQITLSKKGVHKTLSVHQLVAKVFVENPDEKKEVNHKNANKKDNRAENLEWMTRCENANHAYEMNLYRRPKSPVVCLDTGEVFESQRYAARQMGLNPRIINLVVNGRAKTVQGYRFAKA